MESKKSLFQAAAMYFYRHPRTLIALVILYVIMPFDLIPEALVGPIGYVDDFLVMLLPLLLRGYAQRLENAEKTGRKPEDFYDTTAR
jgi:uncharacterized membrane protein YkvA (DUF1232 family)